MRIALFGIGMIGSRIVREALSRGHQVTVVTRTSGKIPWDLVVREVRGDAREADSVAAAVRGHDAVISAVGVGPGEESSLLEASKALLAGTKQAGVPRLLVVGGAGSLEVKPGKQLMDLPEFPAAYRATALAHREVLRLMRQADFDWTYLSPAAVIAPGARTGKFRLGGDQLVVDETGESRISAEDYAVAMIDELELARHIRKRFTVGY